MMIRSQDIEKKPPQNLTSIKGRYPVPNMRKTMIYIINLDIVNDNQYTKFCLILSILSQDIE